MRDHSSSICSRWLGCLCDLHYVLYSRIVGGVVAIFFDTGSFFWLMGLGPAKQQVLFCYWEWESIRHTDSGTFCKLGVLIYVITLVFP